MVKNNSNQEKIHLFLLSTKSQALKANLRLNTKKLYTANGLAVQELLKGVTMLYQASQSAEMEVQDREEMNENMIRSKLSEFKKSRQLASEITSRGANLHDELAKEVMLRVRKSAAGNATPSYALRFAAAFLSIRQRYPRSSLLTSALSPTHRNNAISCSIDLWICKTWRRV